MSGRLYWGSASNNGLVTKWPAPVKGNRLASALVAATLACSVVTEVGWPDRQPATCSRQLAICRLRVYEHGSCNIVALRL